MRLIPGSYSPTIESLSAEIACSQIVVARPYRTVSSLPVGFDHADMSVLDWIAATGSRPSADLGRVIARDPIPFTGGKEASENRRSRSAPANPPNGTTAAGRAIRAPWTIPALGTVCVHHPLVGGRPSLRAARPVFSSLCSKRREWQDLT